MSWLIVFVWIGRDGVCKVLVVGLASIPDVYMVYKRASTNLKSNKSPSDICAYIGCANGINELALRYWTAKKKLNVKRPKCS